MKKRGLICAPQVPTPDRDSGSARIDDWASLLLEAGWEVGLLAERAAGRRYEERLEQRGVRLWLDPKPSAAHAAFAWKPHLALLCFWKTAQRWMPLLRQASPRTRLIVDSIDLHFVRESRQALGGGELLDPEMGFDWIGELNAYAAADAVLTVSEKERRLVDDLTGYSRHAFCVPDGEGDIEPGPEFSQRRGMLFVGNFGHPPNRDAVRFLCRDILPLLEPSLLQEHPLTIAGNAPTEEVLEMAQDAKIRVTGWVPSLPDYFRQALMTLAPLRFGAGTKRKVVQSLNCGTPCVSTPVGVEGLSLEPGQHILVADDAREFARWVERLGQDAELWQRLSQQGRERIRRHHSLQAVSRRFHSALGTVMARPSLPAGLALDLRKQGRHWMKRQYRQLLERIRFEVFRQLPAAARLVVVSKGDEEMLELEGRCARHFPSDQRGAYLGYHPPDGDWAVKRLEEVRAGGYTYLLIPATSLWWLDHYPALGRHLQEHCRLIVNRPDTCLIWKLDLGAEPSCGS